ncbi:MAG: restriction endonuclease subunit S [Anaerolineae bacterium]
MGQNNNPLPEGWVWTTLGEISTKPQYGYTTSASDTPHGPRFLRITDITQGVIDWNKVPYCEVPPDDIAKYRVADGDIVVARAGSVGKAYLVKHPPEAVFASYLMRFRVTAVSEPYIAYYLQSPQYWEQIEASSAGITLLNVNAKKLAAIIVPLPPLAEQERIVAAIEEHLTRLDAGVAALKRAQAKLRRYKAAVLKAACEGRLVPQDPNDEPASALLERIARPSPPPPVPHGERGGRGRGGKRAREGARQGELGI